jgi:hypothetical protein
MTTMGVSVIPVDDAIERIKHSAYTLRVFRVFDIAY